MNWQEGRQEGRAQRRKADVSDVVDGRVIGNVEDRLRVIMHVIYALYAASWLTGGVSTLVGVIIAYVKRRDAAGTVYASHATWLIRTFWGSLWVGLVGFALMMAGVGLVVLLLLGVWMIYRIVKGWLYLVDRRPLYRQAS
ncbi:DUF4870 family protein [Chitinasiproducens palmae]|uniref:Uncharacterized membrane protein n=1 Tax=Chitinasiproducens palmae TaxID=1770053 RepID=A0A1H2PVH6_9BURK|nr:hypothetical protein [Chitinasiproducens palmae]SDV51272.1 Uncharacterized membrane protein [Chitinasiproducens palmae]